MKILSQRTIRDILRGRGGVRADGIPGGQTLGRADLRLAVTGVVDPKKVKHNSSARSGDHC